MKNKKDHRAHSIELMAKTMCLIAGILPVDIDGSFNWWVFNNEAEKIVDDILRRFPSANETQAHIAKD